MAKVGKDCQNRKGKPMSTMNVSLPETQKSFVDQQVSERGYASSSEYIRDLIRREQDKQKLRELLLEGMNSPQAGVADAEYFNQLRERVRAYERS